VADVRLRLAGQVRHALEENHHPDRSAAAWADLLRGDFTPDAGRIDLRDSL
jgi:hypothetical protein